MTKMHIYLYGPPGSGKSTLGQALAASLDLPFIDLDSMITEEVGMSIPDIFANEGEAGFRQRELIALEKVSGSGSRVVALGGGALIDPRARMMVEDTGQVLCLAADLDSLLARISPGNEDRPLLAGNTTERLSKLLVERADHYRSFPLQLKVDGQETSALTHEAQLLLGTFRIHGMGQSYDVRIERGGLSRIGEHFQSRGLKGPIALVCDRNVANFHLEQVMAALRKTSYEARSFIIEPGETHKTIDTVLSMWDFFVQSGIERGSTVVALGGGVVGDMTGFAAATFLRGVAWVNLPTTLLSMVDSSLGGKTGIDLPQAKNLVGAFYPPNLVLADPDVLETLPERELRGGLAEVIKHGIIADPDLFEVCASGWDTVTSNIDRVVRQGMAVKLQVIEEDPYEKGKRQALNLGHTIGHGLELASNFILSHGEAVAVGMAAESRLSEMLGLAEQGLEEKITITLHGLGLPTSIPDGIDIARVVEAMLLDKKRASGKIRFALPTRIGQVRTGVIIDNWQQIILDRALWSEIRPGQVYKIQD